MSVIRSGAGDVAYYNHTRAGGGFSRATIEQMSGIPAVRLELASFGFVVAGFTVINYTTLVGAREVNNQLPAALGAWGVLMVFVCFYFTRFFDARLTAMRARRFERKWKPRLLAFMEERGRQILQAQTGARDQRLRMDGAIGPAR